MIAVNSKDMFLNPMVVTAPYPHPFLFMTDFRKYLLNLLDDNPGQNSCRRQEQCQADPDLFKIVINKLRDLFEAINFYAPVLESFDPDVGSKIVKHKNMVFIAMAIIFITMALPLNTLTIFFLRQPK